MSRRGDLFAIQMIQQFAPLIIARCELRPGGVIDRQMCIRDRDKSIQAYWAHTTIDASLIWKMLWIIVGSIALNFLFSYLRAILQTFLVL